MGILKRQTLQAKSVAEIIVPKQGYAPIDFASIDKAIKSKLTSTEFEVWLYVMKFDCYGNKGKWKDVPSPASMDARLGMDRRTVEKAMGRLAELDFVDEKYILDQYHAGLESKVSARLQSQLGGLTEVTTLAGRIDLLSDSEIIEVKQSGEWRLVMGQMLAYSGFYPEHQKRIHLFAKSDDASYTLSQARSVCDGLGIILTFEEIVS